MLNGLLDARLVQAPILAISGMTYHDLIGTSFLQDFDTDHLCSNVAVYNERIMGPPTWSTWSISPAGPL